MYIATFCLTIFLFNGIHNTMGLSEEMQELANMLHATCQEQTKVPEEQIQDCKHGKFADDDRLKCYMKCLMSEMAVIEDDGSMDLESMKGLLPDEHKEIGIRVLDACGVKFGKDACDTAWLTNICWQSQAPGDYFLI